MNFNKKIKQHQSTHTGTWPKADRAVIAATRRTSPELSASELRGIVIELLG